MPKLKEATYLKHSTDSLSTTCSKTIINNNLETEEVLNSNNNQLIDDNLNKTCENIQNFNTSFFKFNFKNKKKFRYK